MKYYKSLRFEEARKKDIKEQIILIDNVSTLYFREIAFSDSFDFYPSSGCTEGYYFFYFTFYQDEKKGGGGGKNLPKSPHN